MNNVDVIDYLINPVLQENTYKCPDKCDGCNWAVKRCCEHCHQQLSVAFVNRKLRVLEESVEKGINQAS